MLNDADNNVLDGWVREEVGITPWVSPWSWEGYDIIFGYDAPRTCWRPSFCLLSASLSRNLNAMADG
ncbi:hypothetical protein QNM99_15310 [Pseudomonas sp. PCH446]